VAWLASGAAAQEPRPASLAELQKRLADHIAQPRFAAALWGVQIVSLDTGISLFEHNPQKLFSPASNCKLFTVALALDRLGPDYQIKTSLYANAKANRRGTLKGELVVYGRGDPTFNARLHGGDICQALEPCVAALTNAGVKRITGGLVGDASFFHGPEFGAGWAWDDLEYYYGAEISALTINDNTLEVSVKPGPHPGAPCQLALSPPTAYLSLSNLTATAPTGIKRDIVFYRPLGQNVVYISGRIPEDDPGYTDKVTFSNPAGLFVWFLREALARHGIKVRGKLRTGRCVDGQASPFDTGKTIELGSVDSLPLREIVREVQKPSQNLYTDLLLAHVGERLRVAGMSETSEELGVRELNKFLDEAGVPKGEVIFEEGSGLSRDNLATPRATVTLLRYMSRHRWAQVYLDALPIAGVDGTLKNHMKGTPAEGNVRAKTGTLRWANSLSGYVTTAAGERLSFSVMLNRYDSPDRDHSARAEVEAIAILLAAFTGRSGG